MIESLDEITTAQEALDFFYDVVRNLDPGEIERIRSGFVNEKERAMSPKMEAACKAWEKVQSLRGAQ